MDNRTNPAQTSGGSGGGNNFYRNNNYQQRGSSNQGDEFQKPSGNFRNFQNRDNFANQATGGQSNTQLKHINFDLAEIYFPLFVLQMRFDIFPLRNRNYRQYGGNYNNNQDSHQMQPFEACDDDDEVHHEYQRQYYENRNNSFYFILRDQFLITKISITGTVVFQIRKEDRNFFGIDDSTGVMTCVLWFNESSGSGGYGRRQNDFRNWLTENNIGIGSVLTVLGQLEYYKDKIQVNVHKLRKIDDLSEEMLMYQQTIQAQKCFYDPFKPFQRRLFNANLQQQEQSNAVQASTSNIEDVNKTAKNQEKSFLKFSVKRIKKKINDFILSSYTDLFFSGTQQQSDPNKMDIDTSGGSPDEHQEQNTNTELAAIYNKTRLLSTEDFLNHPKLIQKVKEELKFCEDPSKDPIQLLKECLIELEERGFFNLTPNSTDKYVVQIREQRQKLRYFISNQLRSTGRNGMSFEAVYKGVCQQFDNFYTKEFVFKVIDELFQMGLIYETGKCQYAFLEQSF